MVRQPTPVETFFERLTSWVGSVPSLVVHTAVFIAAFLVAGLGYAPWDMVLLIVTTVVSLEAIYLAIFIQMTVNRQARDLHEVTEDVEEIQEDVEEILKDVDEIQEDVEEISEDWDLKDGSLSTPETATLDSLYDELKALVEKIETLRKKP